MKCFLFFHTWSKWQLSHTFGITTYQRKRCLRCGVYRQKEVGKTPYNSLGATLDGPQPHEAPPAERLRPRPCSTRPPRNPPGRR